MHTNLVKRSDADAHGDVLDTGPHKTLFESVGRETVHCEIKCSSTSAILFLYKTHERTVW